MSRQSIEVGKVSNMFFSRRYDRKTGEAGVGIIETALVVAIGLTLMSFSLIVLGPAKGRYDLSHKSQALAWQVERARSLAVKYNQTLTLTFSSQNMTVGLTCACDEAKSELPTLSIPSGLSLSSYPILTIKGNGTISSSASTVNVLDGRNRQVVLTISKAGRILVGEVQPVDSQSKY